MIEWLRRERTKRWLIPALAVLAIMSVVVVAVRLGQDNPLFPLLLVPIVGFAFKGLLDSMARRPKLTLRAVYAGGTTGQKGDGTRVALITNVTLMLANDERGGEALNCKVVLSTIAAPGFLLGPGAKDASHQTIHDEQRIVWQPGPLGPGAERELPLNAQQFDFDDDSASARVRVTADRMDPVVATLAVSVGRYDPDDGAAEFDATVRVK